MKYVVKNCPAITTGYNDKDYICNTHQMGCGHCKDCTDCLIKRVIDKCNSRKGTIMENFAEQILDIFDIERVKG